MSLVDIIFKMAFDYFLANHTRPNRLVLGQDKFRDLKQELPGWEFVYKQDGNLEYLGMIIKVVNKENHIAVEFVDG